MDKPKKWTWEEWTTEQIGYPLEKGCQQCAWEGDWVDAFHVNLPYIEWLESRTADLEKKDYEKDLQFSKHQARRLKQIAKLREALEFYANKDKWLHVTEDGQYYSEAGVMLEKQAGMLFSVISMSDNGERARSALKEIFGEENE